LEHLPEHPVSIESMDELAAITMPDHLHLLAAPLDREASVSAFSKWFKRWFDEEYCRPPEPEGTPRIQAWTWQEGCFDRLLRSDESLSEKWEYLRQNPVRAGLVTEPEDWPYQYASTGSKL
jgi:REP element-mobilizing transposase RayT